MAPKNICHLFIRNFYSVMQFIHAAYSPISFRFFVYGDLKVRDNNSLTNQYTIPNKYLSKSLSTDLKS